MDVLGLRVTKLAGGDQRAEEDGEAGYGKWLAVTLYGDRARCGNDYTVRSYTSPQRRCDSGGRKPFFLTAVIMNNENHRDGDCVNSYSPQAEEVTTCSFRVGKCQEHAQRLLALATSMDECHRLKIECAQFHFRSCSQTRMRTSYSSLHSHNAA